MKTIKKVILTLAVVLIAFLSTAQTVTKYEKVGVIAPYVNVERKVDISNDTTIYSDSYLMFRNFYYKQLISFEMMELDSEYSELKEMIVLIDLSFQVEGSFVKSEETLMSVIYSKAGYYSIYPNKLEDIYFVLNKKQVGKLKEFYNKQQ